MNVGTKMFVREITPPFIFRGMRHLFHVLSSRNRQETWGEKPAEWYDALYEVSAEYRKHYSQSEYYFLWTVLVDRIMRYGLSNILDIGCGPGQFATLLYEKGFKQYCGIDLSPKCIELAKGKCASFEFIVADIFNTNVLKVRDYDCLVALEFLEHVEDDLAVLHKVRSGTRFFGSVPNFPYDSHVRHFTSLNQVRDRYEPHFSSFQVDKFLGDPKGKIFYVMEGIKR